MLATCFISGRLRCRVSLANITPVLTHARRTLTTTAPAERGEGDISAAFASLSGIQFKPLDQRFATIKADLASGHEKALIDSWHRLLSSIRQEIQLIVEQKSSIIPEIDFDQLDSCSEDFRSALHKRGVAVIRNAIPSSEALALKDDLKEYLRQNPHTKAFPADSPQVYELYWSPPQIKARSHPRLLKAQKFLMSFWHSKDENAHISSSHPAVYADRLRMRLPGDTRFALGPHIDSGSCERWEPEGYGLGRVYDKIWQGRWEKYDPWESSCRLPIKTDLYHGIGACSMFRMFQGLMSLSTTAPFEGTLLVNPLFSIATAYCLLRPFFSHKSGNIDPSSTSFPDTFLEADNWELDLSSSNSWLHGATPGHGQELRPHLHPHLKLPETMVHIPCINPGDYVAWHCDTIHSVDNVHRGRSDSTAMYIPTSPLTIGNAEFLARQRQAFLTGTPSPDFGGGKGESEHVGRPGVHEVEQVDSEDGMRAFGLKAWDSTVPGLNLSQRRLLEKANSILGFRR